MDLPGPGIYDQGGRLVGNVRTQADMEEDRLFHQDLWESRDPYVNPHNLPPRSEWTPDEIRMFGQFDETHGDEDWRPGDY